MRGVFQKVGGARVPRLAVALEDGSHFVVDGSVVSAAEFERDFEEAGTDSGSFSVADGEPAQTEGEAPKTKRTRKR